jgi:hypothetical protein
MGSVHPSCYDQIQAYFQVFFFFFCLLYFFPENLPRKSKPLCWPSLPFYRRGRNREEAHKLCMNKGACKEGTACTNSENYSLCTPSSYLSAQPHTILLCFPLLLCSLSLSSQQDSASSAPMLNPQGAVSLTCSKVLFRETTMASFS